MSETPPERLSALALAARLRALTPARVGLAQTGMSLGTRDLLDFQRCHAQARDAVHGRLQAATLAATLTGVTGTEVFCLHSAAWNRATYLQRPDLGRKLDKESLAVLKSHAVDPGTLPKRTGLAVIVADGLSALAVERHSAAVLAELMPRLQGWQICPLCIVEQGRVAIGDEIGETLNAEITVLLIGERPGLSSPDSLGAYITWQPQPGRTDADRNCISNIRGEGLSYAQAAIQLSYYLNEARRRRLTGVLLKEEAPKLGTG
jgi:ethanolamine ammonia-lyase small subunit